MAQDERDILDAGRVASRRHAWRDAFDLLSAAAAAGTAGPEDLERLAEAAWWTGRLAECIAARDRAYAAFVDAGDRRRAARVATEQARNYFQKGNGSVGMAWLKRAERLLQDEPECIEQGYVLRLNTVVAFEAQRDYDRAPALAQQAYDIGVRCGDRDLMALALHDQGRVLVARGQVAEGKALMDEATVAAVSGELGPMTTGIIYCNTIVACKELADYPRAREWTEAAKRWCERQSIAGFPGMCRVYRAGILRQSGAWPEAEQEARSACEELRDFNIGYCGAAFYELGEVRLRQGDLAGAEEAYRQAHELGCEPEPGLALLRLAEGQVRPALAAVTRALAHDSTDRLHRAQLLPALAEIALSAGERDTARGAVEELEEVAKAYGTPALEARAADARGALLLVEGDPAGAERSLRRAAALWREIDSPYEAARTRMRLAEAYRAQGDAQAADLELEAARSTFERLGARIDARRAAALLGADAAAPAPARPEGRVTRTFMLTDIVRSTELVTAIGDDAWTDLARWHDQMLRGLFVRYGGEEIDHAGDGFFVAFADPEPAIECAVAVQRSLDSHRRSHGFAPQVRIGLHRTAATRRGPGYRGKGVHEAARIAATADGGQIVASRATVPAGSRFAASEPRRVRLRGLAEPAEVVTLDWR